VAGIDLSGHRYAHFVVSMRRYPFVGAGYPVAMLVEGYVGAGEGFLYSLWHEPCLENREHDFPVYPERFFLAWDAEKTTLRILDQKQPVSVEQFGEKGAIFNNPAEAYVLFDSVRAWQLCREDEPDAGTATSATDSGRDAYTCASAGDDGRIRRTVTFAFRDGAVASCTIRQEQLMLLHYSPTCYQIRRDVDGQPPQIEEFQPSSRLPYLAGGRRIVIDFAASDLHDGTSMPQRITVYRGESVLFTAEYLSLAYTDRMPDANDYLTSRRSELGDVTARIENAYAFINSKRAVPRPSYYGEDALGGEAPHAVIRQRLKCNIYTATGAGDYDELKHSLALYRALLSHDGIEDDMYVFSVEALTQMAFTFVSENVGTELASSVLKDAYSRCGNSVLTAHVARLIEQRKLGFALMALEVLSHRERPSTPVAAWAGDAGKTVRSLISEPAKWVAEDGRPYIRDYEATARSILRSMDRMTSAKERVR
jgi:hypothetical protein